MANNEVSPTTPTKNADGIRPASCTPAGRNETKLKVENSSPNLRTPPGGRKWPRDKHTRSRTHPSMYSGGDNGSSLIKKLTGAEGRDGLQLGKKMDKIMAAKFEKLSDTDRVKRIRVSSERIIKVNVLYVAIFVVKF